MKATVPVSVIIPCLNEEENIAAALQSVMWAREVVVVDSGSQDATVAIAQSTGARVVDFAYKPGGAKKKAWTLANVKVDNDWILILDADERVPNALAGEIAAAIGNSGVNGYLIDRRFVFGGRVLRCFQPNWNLRLFRNGAGQMEDLGLHDLPGTGDNEIHEQVKVRGRVEYLKHALLHEDCKSLAAWLEKHNRYSTWEAHFYEKVRREPIGASMLEVIRLDPFRRKRVLRRIWVRLPGKAPLRFLMWYVGRRGFLDGRQGLTFCVLMAWYEYTIGVKRRELRLHRGGSASSSSDTRRRT